MLMNGAIHVSVHTLTQVHATHTCTHNICTNMDTCVRTCVHTHAHVLECASIYEQHTQAYLLTHVCVLLCSYTGTHTQVRMCLCTHSLTPHRHTPGTVRKHVLTKRTDREVGKGKSTPLGCVLRISFTSRREKESLSCAEPLTPPEPGLGLQGSLAGAKQDV